MGGKYDAYEFTQFMTAYLNEHPQVVEDQKRGWEKYWKLRKGDRKPLKPPWSESSAGR
jgi:Protein of unknown function (DUF3460)